jgi:HlyD family secretion protein
VDAYSGRDFVGKVRQIRLNSQVLQNVVTYNVVIDVANPEEILLPGMTAFVSIVTAEHKNVLRVPGPALRYKPQSGEGSASPRREGERQVYRLQDGVPVSVQVRTGLSDGKYTEAVSGSVQAGDALVVEDLSETRAGANASGGPAGGQFRVRMF